MPIITVTPPASEPITYAEAKAFLRLPDDAEQTFVESLIVAGRNWCEEATGRALVTQTRALILDAWPAEIKIHCAPITAIDSVKYYGTDGAESTLAGTEYLADLYSEPARIVPAYGKSWPSATLRPINGVKVAFSCGSEAADVPQRLKDAILRHVAYGYEHRDVAADTMNGRGSLSISEEYGKALRNMVADYRVWRF